MKNMTTAKGKKSKPNSRSASRPVPRSATSVNEERLMKLFYDRLFDVITYQPDRVDNPFTEDTTFIHFEQFGQIDPTNFADARSPLNPGGDLGATETFSNLVDRISPLTLKWEPGSDQLSNTYENIILGANAAGTISKGQEARYQKALDFLWTVDEEFGDGEKVESEDWLNYEENKDELIDAIIEFQIGFNSFVDDLTEAENADDDDAKKAAQRDWQVQARRLSSDIRKASRNLTRGNGRRVEKALNILDTTINDGIGIAVANAKEDISGEKKLVSQFNGPDYLPSYALPLDWANSSVSGGDEGGESQLKFTELKIKSTSTREHSEQTEHRFNASASSSGFSGLFRSKVKANGQFQEQSRHFSGDKVELSAKVAKVSIMRPWFNELLFKSSNWFTNFQNGTKFISNGKMDSSNKDNLIPMYPVAFIVAKDIEVKAAFTEEDMEFVSKQVNAGGRVGFGPFTIGGNYSYGHSEKKGEFTFEEGSLKVDGMQIIGWISRLTPASPLLSASEGQAILDRDNSRNSRELVTTAPDTVPEVVPQEAVVEQVAAYKQNKNAYRDKQAKVGLNMGNQSDKDMSIEITINLNGNSYN